MARRNPEIDVGSPVEIHWFDRGTGRSCWVNKGHVVAGYTFWSESYSLLLIDPAGNEVERIHGNGVRKCTT